MFMYIGTIYLFLGGQQFCTFKISILHPKSIYAPSDANLQIFTINKVLESLIEKSIESMCVNVNVL